MGGTFRLRPPERDLLPGYVDALRRGWSPNTLRDVSLEEHAAIAADPEGVMAVLRGELPGSVRLADGRSLERLPGLTRWMWDGEFCGAINLRHQPGRQDLPPHVSGHIGYTVVPWKRRRGYATRALGLVLPLAAERGLAWVDATCDPANEASIRILRAHGGVEIRPQAAADGPGGGSMLFRLATPRR